MIADESVKVLRVRFHQSDSAIGRLIAEPLCRSQCPFVECLPLLIGVRLASQRIKVLVGHCSTPSSAGAQDLPATLSGPALGSGDARFARAKAFLHCPFLRWERESALVRALSRS